MEEPGDVDARFFFLEYLCIGDEKAAGDIFSRKLLLTFWYDKYIVCVAVNFIKIAFYSEWWRYKGSVKPRQPRITQEGANLSEQSNNKRIVYRI